MKFDITFANGVTHRCVGRVGPRGVVIPFRDEADARAHIDRVNEKSGGQHLALAAATGTAKTRNGAECEASQSGPAEQGNAQTHGPTTKDHQNPISGGDN